MRDIILYILYTAIAVTLLFNVLSMAKRIAIMPKVCDLSDVCKSMGGKPLYVPNEFICDFDRL